MRRYGKPDRADVPVSVRRRRQESPILRGERVISRKAIAQGMSDCSPLNLYARVRFLSAYCTRDRGCSAHPAFPAPSFLRDNETQASDRPCRENAELYLLFDIRIGNRRRAACKSTADGCDCDGRRPATDFILRSLRSTCEASVSKDGRKRRTRFHPSRRRAKSRGSSG